jgi:hypothetical protein
MKKRYYVTAFVTILLLVATLALLGQDRMVYGRGRGLSPSRYRALPARAREMAGAARADLARDLGIAQDRIAVLSVAATNFPDSSLGVIEVGRRYLQATTPGYVARLSAADKTYAYHGSDSDGFVRVPAVAESEGMVQRVLRSSVSDLEVRLGVPLDEVVVQSIEEIEFPDGSLGSPLPNVPFPVGPTRGYEVRVLVKGVVYRYWATGDRVVYVDSFLEPSRTVTVYLHRVRGLDPDGWGEVYPVERSLPVTTEATSVLALKELFAGPTEAESATGYVSPSSEATRDALRDIKVEGRTAYVDLADVRGLILTPTDREAFLVEVEETLKAALPVDWVVYSFEGDRLAFCQWIERCENEQ